MKEYTGLLIVLYPAGGFAALTPVNTRDSHRFRLLLFLGQKTMPIKAAGGDGKSVLKVKLLRTEGSGA